MEAAAAAAIEEVDWRQQQPQPQKRWRQCSVVIVTEEVEAATQAEEDAAEDAEAATTA